MGIKIDIDSKPVEFLFEKLGHHQMAGIKAIISLSNIQAIKGIPKECTVNAELGIAYPLET